MEDVFLFGMIWRIDCDLSLIGCASLSLCADPVGQFVWGVKGDRRGLLVRQ